jgi:seryl-tRNA synthetase
VTGRDSTLLDLKFIRNNPEVIRQACRDKRQDADIDRILEIDAGRRRLLNQSESLKAERNRVSQEIAGLHRAGQPDAAAAAQERVRQTNQDIKDLDTRLSVMGEELDALLLRVPNMPHPSVPRGPDETHNVEITRWGRTRNFDFAPLPHWEIGRRLDILDFDRASKIAGARFALLKRAGAQLERALINFMIDVHTTQHDYIELFPPFLVNRSAMTGTGQLPKFEEDLFRVATHDLFLVPTAEVPVTNIHRDEILEAGQLPLNYVAYSACFRAEAGAAGRDTRGLIRNHQFNKVELVKLVRPEGSYNDLERLTRDAQHILELLELPYRTVCLCTGDMSFASAKTYDIEVWLPSFGTYREISSCSNFEAFQARRINTRFRPEPGARPEFVHTLNGSGLAVGRTLAAVLENYQNADGTVTVPEALRKYMQGTARIRR